MIGGNAARASSQRIHIRLRSYAKFVREEKKVDVSSGILSAQ